MCTLTYFEHKTCRHVWAVVTTPCAPLTGFYNCPIFCDGTAKPPPKFIKTNGQPCPKCDLGGVYDRNWVRMVEAMGWGVKIGVGAGRDDWGLEMKCAIL